MSPTVTTSGNVTVIPALTPAWASAGIEASITQATNHTRRLRLRENSFLDLIRLLPSCGSILDHP